MTQLALDIQTEEDRLEEVQAQIAQADETLARYLLDIAAARKERREIRREILELRQQHDQLYIEINRAQETA